MPPYLRKLLALIQCGAVQVTPGSVQGIDILHDDWHGVFAGQHCRCDPEVRVKWSQTAAGRN